MWLGVSALLESAWELSISGASSELLCCAGGIVEGEVCFSLGFLVQNLLARLEFSSPAL